MLHFVNGILTPQGKSANPQTQCHRMFSRETGTCMLVCSTSSLKLLRTSQRQLVFLNRRVKLSDAASGGLRLLAWKHTPQPPVSKIKL